MSDDDPGDEHVQDEIHEHAHGAKASWVAGAALTAAVLAALAAISGSLANTHLTESSRTQIESNDQWTEFASNSIKANTMEAKADLLRALGKESPESDAKKRAKYDLAKEAAKEQAEQKEQLSTHHLAIHETLERGVTFFHIGIAVVAIAVLSKRRSFWFLSLGFGLIGLVFFAFGLMAHL